MKDIYLNEAQFKAEMQKCLQCPSKPCEKACPAGVSPHDFIAAALNGNIKKAGELILKQNPFGETCGLICPDKFCQKACLRSHLDCAINIPKIQAYIIKKYRENKMLNNYKPEEKAEKFAVIGSGPAGIGAAAILLEKGFAVEVFEKKSNSGGALNLIPNERLPKEVIGSDWQRLAENKRLNFHFDSEITEPEKLLQNFDGVIFAGGENIFYKLGIKGEDLTVNYNKYLAEPQKYAGLRNVAIVGGGAVAVDCAVTARNNGAENVEMFVRRRLGNMRISKNEFEWLRTNNIDVTTMTRITKVIKEDEKLTAFVCKTQFNEAGKLEDVENSEIARKGFDLIVSALGSTSNNLPNESKNIVLAGDCVNGSSTAVEAVASGKDAAHKLLKNLSFD